MNALVSFLQTSWCSCIRPVSPGSSVTMLTTSPKFQGEHLSCSPHPSLSAVALCRQLICPSGGSVVVRSLPLIIMSQKTHWLCGISVGVRCHIARLCTVLKMDPAWALLITVLCTCRGLWGGGCSEEEKEDGRGGPILESEQPSHATGEEGTLDGILHTLPIQCEQNSSIKFFKKARKCQVFHNYYALYFFLDEWVQVQFHCLPGWGLVAAEWVLSLLLPCRGSGVHEGDVCSPLMLQPHKSSWAMLSAVLDERKIDPPLCLFFRDTISLLTVVCHYLWSEFVVLF